MKQKIIFLGILVLAGALLSGGLLKAKLNGQNRTTLQEADALQRIESNQLPNVKDGSQSVAVIDELGNEIIFDTSDWRTYRNDEYGFSVKYPAKYEINIPVVNNEFRANEYTVFLFNIRHTGMEDHIGYGFTLDTEIPETTTNLKRGYTLRPHEFLFRTLTQESGRQITVSYNLASSFENHASTNFTIRGLYVESGTFDYLESASETYSFAEYQAILSTFDY